MNPYEAVLLDRIRQLWHWHQHEYRSHLGWLYAALDNDRELRSLLRLAREARWHEAAMPDWLTAAKAEAERRVAPETELELAGAWGR